MEGSLMHLKPERTLGAVPSHAEPERNGLRWFATGLMVLLGLGAGIVVGFVVGVATGVIPFMLC